MHAFDLDERTVASWRDRGGKQCERVHQAIVEQGKLDLLHVQADEIRVKARGMIAWMGLIASTPNSRNQPCNKSLKPDVRRLDAESHSAISRWKHIA